MLFVSFEYVRKEVSVVLILDGREIENQTECVFSIAQKAANGAIIAAYFTQKKFVPG
jgi:hypothetical protein